MHTCATCSLDPMPASFIKQHASVLVPDITNITNESLRSVNHSTLLRVLQHRIGLGGTAIMWFESYLTERTNAVAIGDSTALSVALQRRVLQGSVLGPILFTIYTLHLGDIVRRHDLNGHFYADDMQLFVFAFWCVYSLSLEWVAFQPGSSPITIQMYDNIAARVSVRR